MKKSSYLLFGAVIISILLSASSSFGLITSNKNDNIVIVQETQTGGAELEVTTDKNVYELGITVTIFFTNIGDEILSGGGPIVSYYNDENELVYQEAVYCWWELEPGEYFTWTWNQKDFDNEQVPVGEYTVEGFLSGVENGFVDTATFYILDCDPPGPPNGPTEGRVNESYTFCIDLPDEVPCEPYHVIWDWGDGTMSEWSGPYAAGETACADHLWSEPGSYEVRAGIKDGCGREYWTDPLIVNISFNKPPSAPDISGPIRARAGVILDYTFQSVDPEDDKIYYYIDWYDGTVEDWFGPFDSGEEVVVSHVWEKMGTYTIKAKAKDIYDAESDWGNKPIEIPRNKFPINSLFMRLLERFSDAFPILKNFLKL